MLQLMYFFGVTLHISCDTSQGSSLNGKLPTVLNYFGATAASSYDSTNALHVLFQKHKDIT